MPMVMTPFVAHTRPYQGGRLYLLDHHQAAQLVSIWPRQQPITTPRSHSSVQPLRPASFDLVPHKDPFATIDPVLRPTTLLACLDHTCRRSPISQPARPRFLFTFILLQRLHLGSFFPSCLHPRTHVFASASSYHRTSLLRRTRLTSHVTSRARPERQTFFHLTINIRATQVAL